MGIVSFLLLIAFIGPQAAEYQDQKFEHSRAEVNGIELSELYKALSQQKEAPLSDSDLLSLRKFQIMIVPGFLSNSTTGIRSEFTKLMPWIFKSKEGPEDWLERMQISHSRLVLESEGSIEFNSALVTKAIREAELPLILISHSKGGLDTMEALIKNPELQSKVKGWIAVDPPFYGTPVSDVWIADPQYRKYADLVLKKLGGSIDCLVQMQMSERVPYMETNQKEISDLVSKIPVITFGGDVDDVAGRWDTVFEPYFRDQLIAAGIESDGVVPWRNTVIPGNPYIRAKGVDHVMPLGNISFMPFDRIRFIQSMLKLLLERQKPL